MRAIALAVLLLPAQLAAAAPIRLRTATGRIETISPAAFRERFGVEHLSALRVAPGMPEFFPSWLRVSAQFIEREAASRGPVRRGFNRLLSRLPMVGPDIVELGRLYGEQVAEGRTADVYLDRIDDTVGWGVRAERRIARGELIGEYTGVILPPGDPRASGTNAYLMSYARSPGVAIDAREAGNVTRFINHSSFRPNAEPAAMFHGGLWHMLLVAKRRILPGEQVLFDYGPRYWDRRPKPKDLR